MLKLFIYTLLVIIAALVVTLYLDIPNDPGYILLAWGNYTFETSIFALAVLFVFLGIVIRLMFLLFSWVNPWHLIRYGRRYREMRQNRSRSKTNEGLMHFARSNWESAFNVLSRSYNENDASEINYLAAAYAAFAMDRKDLWMSCLDKAARAFPGSLSTINSVRAEFLFRTDHLEQSLAVLEQLQKTSINDHHLLSLLKDIYIKLEDWERLRELLPKLNKAEVLSTEELDNIEKLLFVAELRTLTEEISEDSQLRESHLATMQKKWRKAPAKFKNDERMVRHYADLLISISANTEAAVAIEEFLHKNWSDPLVEKYGKENLSDHTRQLAVAEQWLKEQPNNATLLLALGRISMRNKLWGKAKEYFETSLQLSASADVFGELSRLTRSLGDSESSEIYFRKYYEAAGNELPQLPMPPKLDRKAG